MEIKGRPIKGYGLTLAANACFAVVFLITKDVKPEMGLYPFLFYWFLCATVYYLFTIVTARDRKMFKIPRRWLPLTMLMGVFEIVATFLFFFTIRLMNPAVASFYGNVSIVMTIALGVIFLGERFAALEALGSLILGVGVLLMTYSAGRSGLLGFLLIMLLSLLFSINNVLAKVSLKEIHPVALSTYRTFLLFTAITVAFVFQADQSFPEPATFLKIALGAFAGPFVGVFLSFSGLQYIEASKASLVKATAPLMVLIGSYFWLQQAPMMIQGIGGVISLAGIELLLWGKFKGERGISHFHSAG